MKLAERIVSLAFLVFLATTVASAQTVPPPGTFQHIIIVVQENRTPDNLFGAGPAIVQCGNEDPFESGVDIVDGGPAKGYPYQCFTPLALNGEYASTGCGKNGTSPCYYDPEHYFWAWKLDYDNSQMDGFCHDPAGNGACLAYTYVPQSQVQPYFDIATNYGFANYMFQTNEGPSLEAHQFLFTGTSAPVGPNDDYGNYNLDFVADLPQAKTQLTGCPLGGGWQRCRAGVGLHNGLRTG
jgi:phospholipase C